MSFRHIYARKKKTKAAAVIAKNAQNVGPECHRTTGGTHRTVLFEFVITSAHLRKNQNFVAARNPVSQVLVMKKCYAFKVAAGNPTTSTCISAHFFPGEIRVRVCAAAAAEGESAFISRKREVLFPLPVY